MGFFPDSSVLSQIFQMVFFLDYAATTQKSLEKIPSGISVTTQKSLEKIPYGISVPTQETCYSSIV
jgi:hypothetical protein